MISRRDFLKGLGASAVVSALAAGSGFTAFAEDAAADAIGEVKEVVDTDILIVGCGAAGMFASYEAGKAGTGKVLVISNSPNSEYTNGGMVSGTCALETPYLKEMGQTFSNNELFDIMYNYSHFTVNGNLLHKCVDLMTTNIDIFNEMGIDFQVGGDRYGFGFYNVHLFATSGKNTIMQNYMTENFGVEFRFSLDAFAPIMDDGKVVGIYAKNADGETVQINAKAVILACGGYLADKAQMEKNFGVTVVPFSTECQNGHGISIAEQAGAYREIQTGLGMTDIVGASEKVGFTFGNALMMLAFFGNLLVDHTGKRFMNEYEIANESMAVGGEALLHVKKYYAIYSQATVDALKTTSYWDHIGQPACWPTGGLLYVNPMENIQELMDAGIEGGYVFKADSIEELAEQVELPNLVDAVRSYDEICATGIDTQFGKDMSLGEAVEVGGPYYLIQFNAGAFNTFGGCRTNDKAEALTADFDVIPGLYIAGVENGSLYARPYYSVGGTCSGLAYSSGRIAGMNAAEYVK